MTPAQREQMQREMSRAAALEGIDGNRLASLGPIAALSAAQLSGFGIYLFATTALSAVTGVIGVTLPFAAYTVMSSAISVAIGPVGWIGAGLFAIWKLTGSNYKKLIPAVLIIVALRDKYSPKAPPKEKGEGGWLRWVLLAIGVFGYAIWPSSKPAPTPATSSAQTVAAKPAIAAQNTAPVEPKAQQTTKHRDIQEKPKAAIIPKPSRQSDMRHCLNLPTDVEIARCASGQ